MRHRLGYQRALAAHRVGAVEDQRVESVAVTERVRLPQEGAVGVAVERDPIEPERGAHGVDVVGGRRGPIGPVAVARGCARTGRRPGGPCPRPAGGRGSRSPASGRSRACRPSPGRGAAARARACGRSSGRCRSSRSPARPRRRRSGARRRASRCRRARRTAKRIGIVPERRVGALERHPQRAAAQALRPDVLRALGELRAGRGRVRRRPGVGAREHQAGQRHGARGDRAAQRRRRSPSTSLASTPAPFARRR